MKALKLLSFLFQTLANNAEIFWNIDPLITICLIRNSKRGGMATHAGVALELGITRPSAGAGGMKMMSPQMEAILIWCQCRTRNYKVMFIGKVSF